MARPQKTIQRKPSGIFQAVVWIEGKRHARSLETRNERVATKRAAQAVAEIEAATGQGPQTRWHADEPVLLGDPANDKAELVTWADIAQPDEILPPRGTTWRELIKEAVRVRKGKKGEDYSDGWYAGMQYATQRVPFGPLEATPPLIREWLISMERDGQKARTREINAANLRSLIKISMKSGLLHQLQVNPFSLVDFSTEEVRHIPTMLEADYRGLAELLPSLPKNQRVGMLAQAYTGVRISEIRRRGAADFDLTAGTFTIDHDPGAGKRVKNKHSIRTIPIPQELCDELAGFDFNWPSVDVINKKLKRVNPELSSHSFRHGLVRLNRDLAGDADVVEAYVGHSLKGMKATYGDGFSVERFQEVLEPVWSQLNEWIK